MSSPSLRLVLMKIESITRQNPALRDLSIDECLRLAVEAEDFAKQVGAFDLAYPTFLRQAEGFFQLAHLFEQRDSLGVETHVL